MGPERKERLFSTDELERHRQELDVLIEQTSNLLGQLQEMIERSKALAQKTRAITAESRKKP